MLTISLDEFGHFEEDTKEPLFIAGVIYDDYEQSGEEALERERIEAYYKAVIGEVNTEYLYPEALHSNGDRERDHQIVRPVKRKVNETLSEFISCGTYQGNRLKRNTGAYFNDRKGKYHLFVILKSDDGKKSLLGDNVSILARDNYAANLYVHMASSVVNRILFHNPLYSEGMPPIAIDVASRASGDLLRMDEDKKKEFRKQAFRENEGNRNSYYAISNGDIYRTIISQEMVNTGNVKLNIRNFRVSPITYSQNAVRGEFLYLSDSICSLLQYDLPKEKTADDWLEITDQKVSELNGTDENLVFGYDAADNDFFEAWKMYEKRNVFDSLSESYDAKQKKGAFAKYYKDRWFPYLEERIRNAVSPEVFRRELGRLSNYLLTNNLNQDKLIYLLGQFEKMLPKVIGKFGSIDMEKKVLFQLYDAGVSAYCHIGDAIKALEYFEKEKTCSYYVGAEAFLTTRNKLIVCLEDCFEWERALSMAKENIDNQSLINEMKTDILGYSEEYDQQEGKAISQYARVLAEMRNEEAEIQFRLALSKMGKGTANYKMTQSFLLHYYADMGMKEEYEKEATDYFEGNKTYNQRLRFVLNLELSSHSVFSRKFALYVLVRGLFSFGLDTLDENLWKKLCEMDELLEKADQRVHGGHPWEFIYKYLEALAVIQKDEKQEKIFRDRREKCLNNRSILIELCEDFGEVEIAQLKQDLVLRDKKTKEMTEKIQASMKKLKEYHFSENAEERYDELKQVFTFMFH